jgi:DNA-binding response OmpR family regulator
MAVKILLADDESRMRRLVSDFLRREGYVVNEVADGKEAIDVFTKEDDFDLVILDVMMPVYDGWTVCREIRKSSKIPIIMLTARSSERDELFGFELGADEYVSKPFSPLILVARVQALLKRAASDENSVRDYSGLEINEGGRSVKVNGETINLSPKEFELLSYLTVNEGVALSREQILNCVWKYDYLGDARTIDTHVKKLRLKLMDKGEYIHTVRGFGYKFEA